jgi:hypothetical protein
MRMYVQPTNYAVRPVSDKQAAFLQRLLDERDTTGIDVPALSTLTGGREGTASALIDALLRAPQKVRPPTPDEVGTGLDISVIPAGRYAIEDDDGRLRFIKVDRVDAEKDRGSRWFGFTFVKQQSSDFFPARDRLGRQRPGGFYQGEHPEMLARIAQDPEAASKRYGTELGVCGVCGRELTDEVSRALGIGPVCRSQRGW